MQNVKEVNKYQICLTASLYMYMQFSSSHVLRYRAERLKFQGTFTISAHSLSYIYPWMELVNNFLGKW